MKIVTSGRTFLDIDAYAACIAYAELLNLKGVEAVPFSSATINESVPPSVRAWQTPFTSIYKPSDDDSFILIDVSEPEFLEKTVNLERIEEVIDHHVGYEAFWQARIGDKAIIEFIGAACTLVYERWVEEDLIKQMSQVSARLLIAGILDNTLDFKAGVTSGRDKQAYNELMKIADLPADWSAQYFRECEQEIFNELPSALVNDLKLMRFQSLSDDNIAFGQLVLWDGQEIVTKHLETLERVMSVHSQQWFVNVVSIGEGKSYFVCSDTKMRSGTEKVLGVHYDGLIADAGKLWLRKEIVKQDLTYNQLV